MEDNTLIFMCDIADLLFVGYFVVWQLWYSAFLQQQSPS